MSDTEQNSHPVINHDHEVLDDVTLEAVREGLRSEETGRFYTWDEVKQFARERRKAWTEAPIRRSA